MKVCDPFSIRAMSIQYPFNSCSIFVFLNGRPCNRRETGRVFWHILYINANMQCEVILFVCASVRVCVSVCA